MRLGADDFLSKPANSAELVESIARVLDKKRRLSSLVAANALSSSGELRAHYSSALKQTETAEPSLAAGRPEPDEVAQPGATVALPQAGELRTIVACGIEDFGALSGRMRSDDLSALLDRYLHASIQPILAYGGQVIKLSGERVIAVFGHRPGDAPSAAASAALQAALEIVGQTKATTIETTLPRSMLAPSFKVGAGVHSGLVMVDDAGENLAASGEGVDVACRLSDRTASLGWEVVASTAAIEIAGPDSGIQAGLAQPLDMGTGGKLLLVQRLDLASPILSALMAGGSPAAAPGIALNAALTAVLRENARSGAEASKEALDDALEAINVAQTSWPPVIDQAQEPRKRLAAQSV